MSNQEVLQIAEDRNLTAVERFKSIFSMYVEHPAKDRMATVTDRGVKKVVYFCEDGSTTGKVDSSIVVGYDENKSPDFDLVLTEFDPSSGAEPILRIERDADSEEPLTTDPKQVELALGRVAKMLSVSEIN